MKIRFCICCCLFSIAAMFICGGLSPVSAQKQEERPMRQCSKRFATMDTDNNGEVTREEFLGFAHRGNGNPEDVFASRDGDSDGTLTREEFCSGKRGGRGECQGKGRGKGKNNW